jgi:leader peptidase (prepilin peptidase)/N-methyltransferase
MMNLYLYICIVILIALAVIDFKTFMLPNYLTYPFVLSGLAINFFSSTRLCSPTESMSGAIIGFVTLWLCNQELFIT